MAINYAKIKQTAVRLLLQNGQAVTLTQIARVDNGDGSVSSTEIEYVGNGVVGGFTEHDAQIFADLQANDARIVADLPTRLQRGDAINVNGKTWRVVEFREVNPADMPIIYIIQARA